jgi:outer membrane protein OmpA-like peptidoglycan-associated protein
MRKLALLALLTFGLLLQSLGAQNREFPNAIHAKINLLDYGALFDGNMKLSEGFEFGYFRNVGNFLNIGVPFKLGLAKLPKVSGNTVTTSLDVIAHVENLNKKAKISPYAFAGTGVFLESFGNAHVQFPFGAGVNFNVTPYAFINAQLEFRKALVDNRDNIQLGIGYVYLLHKETPKEVLPPDTDKDGVPDSLDHCPTIAGPPVAFGCPDADLDGVPDATDACPKEPGTQLTNGCPDADSDGVADKDDDCPTDAGTLKGCPDTDHDGVADKDDQCPTVAGTLKGCPDKDNDGVADKDDKCPNEPGPASNQGCPEVQDRDTDGDGVADSKDECPTVAGPVKGCPDADNDGVADKDDKCPTVAGPASNNGCPVVKDTDGDGVPDDTDPCPTIAGKFGGCPDTDGDGVADNLDKCPTVAGTVANNGCPEVKDTDGDGVPDDQDKCPTVAGPASNKGCPEVKDTDGDGVPDKDDKCPTVAGPASNKGCPEVKDTDGDGVPDDQDKCPTVAGPASNNGCPVAKDSDGDGVPDDQDPCPKVAGKFGGCPDTDGDGVPDNKDKCPSTAGPASNNGCPEIKKEVTERLAYATKAVQFETGKALLKNESYAVLDEVVGIMRSNPDYRLSISGYTDNVGNDESNLKLSQNRAKACFDYLIFRGIKAERMRNAGFGEARPIADNKTEEGRELNRRVEFELFFD